MALDGFSLRQVGLAQDNTSAQMAMNTEQSIRQGLGMKSVDQIANMDSEKAVTLEEEKEKEKPPKKRTKLKKRKVKADGTKSEEAYTIDTESLDSNIKDLDFYTKFADKLAIRLNNTAEVIELYNTDTNKTVETISAKDLIKLIDKLKISSGVLVNRKI